MHVWSTPIFAMSALVCLLPGMQILSTYLNPMAHHHRHWLLSKRSQKVQSTACTYFSVSHFAWGGAHCDDDARSSAAAKGRGILHLRPSEIKRSSPEEGSLLAGRSTRTWQRFWSMVCLLLLHCCPTQSVTVGSQLDEIIEIGIFCAWGFFFLPHSLSVLHWACWVMCPPIFVEGR